MQEALIISYCLIESDEFGVSVGLYWGSDEIDDWGKIKAAITEKKDKFVDEFKQIEPEDPSQNGIWIDNNSPDFDQDLKNHEDPAEPLVERIIELRNFANRIPTLRKATGYGETRGKRRNS